MGIIKASAFYFAKSDKLTNELKETINQKDAEKKERILQEQINLYLEAVIKEVNEDC